MKPPIFVVCSDREILVYQDPTRLLKYAESPDVESGQYLAVFDAEGRRFKLDVEEPTRRRKFLFVKWIELTPLTLTALEEAPTGAGELRALLAEQLPVVASDAPLADLVRLALTKLRSP